MSAAFDRPFAFGELPPSLATSVSTASRAPLATLPLADVQLDARGRVLVADLVRAARRADSDSARLLVVTSVDLAVPECASLFGFTDRRRGVAVVSTARLEDQDSARASARLGNVIAHEAGHLDGLAHCESDRCLMHTASTVEELDRRPEARCGRCPRAGMFRRRVLAAAALVGLVGASVLTLDTLGTALLGPSLELPFT